ncbi:hypothetical protein Tsubulata_032522 [Turnera subulata]|uniref:Beta-galactosidase n=1 Tax=Turnera subulata TaxID=218843 RepID=A0A9Q0FV59_9ROSI|nr:hypothetical protein Tsubulata_032522 [Turnera subulata]
MGWRACWIIMLWMTITTDQLGCVRGGNVTYDGRSLIIDGHRKILFSGSIHYPRSTPEMWPSLIAKAKEGGLDVIQTYVFWNLHEPKPGEYDFSGRYDLVRFMKEIQAQGLYACLRIGPFIEAEWNYGGFPFWLHDVPGIVYRSDNGPFKYYMQNFTTKIVNLMKSEGLYASQGGPIILSQIENEYQNVEAAFGKKGSRYVRWAAKMAVELQTGVPWVMCKQTDAPDPVINTCNGMRCGETFGGPNSPNKPSLWTEDWTSLQPKWGHLKELHLAIKSCTRTLLQGAQTNISLGQLQQAYVFEEDGGSGSAAGCVAFLVNNDQQNNATVEFRNASFELIPKSITILRDCTTIIFNTAKVNTEYNNRIITSSQVFDNVEEWEEYKEVIPNYSDSELKSDVLLEHANTTKDISDYLWYTFSPTQLARNQCFMWSLLPTLHMPLSTANMQHGSHDVKGGFSLEAPIVLNDGINNISILSVMVGLPEKGLKSTKKKDPAAWRGVKLIFLGLQLKVVLGIRYSIKIEFDMPAGNDPVAVNLSTMGKGEAWVNGFGIGRYWVSFHTPKGRPSQELYHVPRSVLKASKNLLVLFEESGGDPLHVSLVTVSTTKLRETAFDYNLYDNSSIVTFFLFSALVTLCSAGNITYDSRSLVIDGQRKLLISASIHYPRSVPGMWPGLVQTAKEGGVDVIETYVFWNGHEIAPNQYNFEGRYDLVKFVKIVQQAGMHLILRIGPFVAAEWNFGGVPVWLHYVPGTVFRTDNENFKVENEYGYYEKDYGEGGKRYAKWAADMAVSQNIGVPWIMCQQFDSPPSVINTCNSFYCDQFKPIFPDKPKIWTENWPGWFQTFGAPNPHRPAEDVAFSVARFFQKGGSVQNYYMYHGGTNFGRTAGGPFITTSYDYEAPIDEYGLPNLPKWGHLKELHRAIKLCEQTILNSVPVNMSLGPSQEADIYTDASGCVAFLANMDEKEDKTVQFRNMSYHLPAWSVSILPDCKNVVFNTAKVNSQTAVVEMVPEDLQSSAVPSKKSSKALTWEVFVEKAGIWGEADFVKKGFVDHINTTQDTTDYLWYTTSPSGNGTHSPFTFKSSISLKPGKNDIALLSMTVGLQNAGSFYEWVGAGLTGVKIKGFNNGTVDLSTYNWTYKIGLQGEKLGIYKADGSNNVKWVATEKPPKKQPLTWYKAIVDPPAGDEPVGLDMLHMGKGLAWLNGEEIGRYWPRKSSVHEKCVDHCDYRGKFMPDKCFTGCGQPTQRWYHVPRSWFKPSGNVLVIFEEKGGDPTKIAFSRRKISSTCALVAEDYPVAEHNSLQEAGTQSSSSKASVHLKCPENSRISSVKFASFGSPTGTCGSYSIGTCHDPNSISVVEKVCLNKNECAVELAQENFQKDLCPGTTKKLAVEAVCS